VPTRAGQDEQPPDAHLSREPRPEHARGEASDALRRDDQAGHKRRLVQRLLEVQGQHEHLAAVPQSEQEGDHCAIAQPWQEQEARLTGRVVVESARIVRLAATPLSRLIALLPLARGERSEEAKASRRTGPM
jgi:hypothetical protein